MLIRLQAIQDLLSEKTGLSLTLYDHKLQEVTIPSGMPQHCLQTAPHHKECLSYIFKNFELAQQEAAPIMVSCHKKLHVFAFPTAIEKAGQKLFLIGGCTADPNKIEEHLDLITAIYGLPLKITRDKEQSYPATPAEVLKLQIVYGLTRQEINILILIGKGYSNQEIASRLYISMNTVKTHVSNILRKLGAENRTEAALFAFDRGIIQDDSSH